MQAILNASHPSISYLLFSPKMIALFFTKLFGWPGTSGLAQKKKSVFKGKSVIHPSLAQHPDIKRSSECWLVLNGRKRLGDAIRKFQKTPKKSMGNPRKNVKTKFLIQSTICDNRDNHPEKSVQESIFRVFC
ncbi:hypothetical protein DdX_15496 [Ditylenchus destructor]|uniref:Uncharacterized protein n=1 Tax=Ditylenchus destructor TaxID=166010 RepID=A0AAD4QXN1_9BILA|nr:hypothetical protein DdX_15496 [Ditylenchus destructor]